MEEYSETVKTNQQASMSPSIAKLAAALSKAQGEMENAKKDSKGYNYNYADLASVIGTAKKPLADNGLAVTQLIEPDATVALVKTLLVHSSGEWVSSTVSIKPLKADPQGMGSAITYARRYGYQAIIGLSAEDDDGNTASAKQEKDPTESWPKQTSASAGKCPECFATVGHSPKCSRRGAQS